MKFERITHYVEKSFEGKPSFIIILSDENGEKEFISNGCVFVETTKDNLNELIKKYNCEKYIEQLLNSKIDNYDNITDFRYMLNGCTSLTNVELSLPEATNCSGMLEGCTSLTNVELSLPMAKNCWGMLEGCSSLTSVELSLPEATNCSGMLEGCTSLTKENTIIKFK